MAAVRLFGLDDGGVDVLVEDESAPEAAADGGIDGREDACAV